MRRSRAPWRTEALIVELAIIEKRPGWAGLREWRRNYDWDLRIMGN